jgi:N-acetylmuramic acid 6-phosphate etherase
MPSYDEIQRLRTEQINPASADLDTKSALEIASIINAEDAKVASAVRKVLPQIARAIDAIANALARGGRLIYVGAGTSGRIAALDAAEVPPTYGIDREKVQFVMAGGDKALGRAREANEDSRELGERDLAARRISNKDVVVGIAASGRTPYTLAALEFAKRKGAKTVAVVCNTGSHLGRTADIAIEVPVGPEVVNGSTRMKAGTAQKMVLNMLSTGAMVRLGYVYGNLMVNVQTRNEKLMQRGVRILKRATGATRVEAERALRDSGMSVPLALVMLHTGLPKSKAERRLKDADGNVRKALTMPSNGKPGK